MPDFRPQSTDDDLDSPGEIYATKFVSEVAALVLRSPGLRASHFDSGAIGAAIDFRATNTI